MRQRAAHQNNLKKRERQEINKKMESGWILFFVHLRSGKLPCELRDWNLRPHSAKERERDRERMMMIFVSFSSPSFNSIERKESFIFQQKRRIVFTWGN